MFNDSIKILEYGIKIFICLDKFHLSSFKVTKWIHQFELILVFVLSYEVVRMLQIFFVLKILNVN